jgi:hypothetical protein
MASRVTAAFCHSIAARCFVAGLGVPPARLPFRVDFYQTGNGGEFGSQFHYRVLDGGIGHVYIKPATPRLEKCVMISPHRR